MKLETKVALEFGTPEVGWLPTNFRHGDFSLEIDISDVPIDPMIQLCDALIGISKGIKEPNRIIWHLEPYCYYLQLKELKGAYQIIISESDNFESPAKITTKVSGSFEGLIMPLYRALKKFWSRSFEPPNWDKLDSNRIEELTKLIKKKRSEL